MTKKTHIAITGASGFIGAEMINYFAERDCQITAYVRIVPTKLIKNVIYVVFNLIEGRITGLPDDLDEFIHLAYVKHDQNNNSDEINFAFCKWLKIEAEKRKFKVTYLSSFSATSNAISHYGKSKFACENLFEIKSALILKPGLVIGNGGLFLKIKKEIQNAKFIILPDGGTQQLQTIDINDLFLIIEDAIKKKTTGLYWLAHPQVHTLKEFELQLAKIMDRNPIFIHVPMRFVLFCVKFVNMFGIKLAVSLESVLGLKALKAHDTKDSLKKLDVNLLGLNDTLKKYHG